MQTFKRYIVSGAHNLGYTVVPNWRLGDLAQVNFLKKLFAWLNIDCVLDVGANRGQFGEFLRREVGFRGQIISFEPLQDCVKDLEKLARVDGRWAIEPYALGRTRGRANFNVMADTEFSSFWNPRQSGMESAEFGAKNRVVREVVVEVKTLRDVIPQVLERVGASAPYLKLDTQGFDLEVVAGAGPEIRRFRALQTEASVVPIYANAPALPEALTALRELGFEVSGIFPNHPERFPVLFEVDCHMINAQCLPGTAQDRARQG
jgi:FkbM family methyltransferase